MPAISTRRLFRSTTRNTQNRTSPRHESTSTVKKSQAASDSQWPLPDVLSSAALLRPVDLPVRTYSSPFAYYVVAQDRCRGRAAALYGIGAEFKAEILHHAADSSVAPRSCLSCDFHNPCFQRWRDSGSSGSSALGPVVLLSNELPKRAGRS